MERTSTSVTSSVSATSSGKGTPAAMDGAMATAQLGNVKSVGPMIVAHTDTMSMTQGLMVMGKDIGGKDAVLKISAEGPSDISQQNGIMDADMPASVSMESILISALQVANNPLWAIEELEAGGRKGVSSELPIEAVGDTAGTVVTAQPGPSDMAALQDILANMEPAAGESGGAGRAGGAGFGSAIDPAILMGLDRLGGIAAITGLGEGLLNSGRLTSGDLVFRTAASVSNSAESADDTQVFEGSNGVAGIGNILVNDVSTSGSLVLKSITLNGVVHDVPETGIVTIVGTMGTLAIDARGDYSYTPLDAGLVGSDIGGVDLFEYTAQDAAGIVTTATLAVTVNDKIPVAVDDVIATDNMTLTRSGNLLSGDSAGNGTTQIAILNGQVMTAAGITITNPGLGYTIIVQADGSYTLSADNGRTGVDTLTYSTADTDGDVSGTATVAISFSDTTPTLTSKIIASTNMNLVTSGHLITSADQTGDGTAHIQTVAGQPAPAGGVWTIDTADYTLTITQDGAYRLEGKNGHTAANVTLPFTIADADGDVSNTVTVTLSVADALPVAIDDPDGIRGVLTDIVNQRVTSVTTATISPAINEPGSSLGDKGTFSLISSSQGKYGSITILPDGSYTYMMDAAKSDLVAAYQNTGKAPEDIFIYRVTDEDGDISEAQLIVRVQDDGGTTWSLGNLTPTGVNDDIALAGQLEMASQRIQGSVVGNVLSNGDILGNNPAVVTLVGGNTGAFGSLMLRSDGSYVYTLDSRATKMSLQGSPVETFTYRITDVDGDTSTATLTVHIGSDGSWSQNNTTPTAVDDLDTVIGGLNIATQQVMGTKAGTVLGNDDDGDGVLRVELAGSSKGAHGTLTLNADGTYSYALNDSKLNLQGTPTDTFTYHIIDRDGDISNTATLTIQIGSDGSWSQNNQITNAQDDLETMMGTLVGARVMGTLSGKNVIANDTAGDDPATVALTGSNIGRFGTLTLNADGSYSYALNADKNAMTGDLRDRFTYTLTDKDGDTSTATLIISIQSDGTWVANNTTPDANNGNGGRSAGEVALTGNIIASLVAGGDGTRTITSIRINGGADIPVTGTSTVHEGTYGRLTIQSDGTYTYVGKDDATGSDIITYTVRDADGDTDTAALTLSARDNNPEARDDTVNTTNMVLTKTGNIITGTNATADTVGDGTTRLETVVINGVTHPIAAGGSVTLSLGNGVTLQMGSNGAYTLSAQDKVAGSTTLTYTLIDSDGDRDTASMNLSWSDLVPVAIDDRDALTGRLDLANQMVTGSITTTIAPAIGMVGTSLGDSGTFTLISSVQGKYGTITLNSDGSYTYVFSARKLDLIEEYKNTGDNPQDVFTYRITDQDGDVSTANLIMMIEDDGGITWRLDNHLPNIDDVTNATVATQIAPITGTIPLTAGDGTTSLSVNGTAITAVGTQIVGTHGTLTIKADGTYSYVANNNANGTDRFNLAVRDADGDTDTATLTLSALDKLPTATLVPISATGDGSAQITTSGNLLATSSGGDGSLRVGSVFGIDIPNSGSKTLTGADLNLAGTIVYLTVHSNGSYTLVSAAGASMNGSLSYSVVDQDGDTSYSSVTINITNTDAVASAPTLSVDALSFAEDSTGQLIIRATNTDTNSERLIVTATIPTGWTIIDAMGGTVSGNTWTRALGVGESLSGGPVVQAPANWNGSSTIPVSVTSTETNGGATSSPISISAPVTVTAVNDAPTITATGTGAVLENAATGTVVTGVTLAKADPDAGDTTTWEIVSGNTGNAFKIDAATGVISTNQVLDRESVSGYDLVVRAKDTGGLTSATQTVHINVTNVNEAPSLTMARMYYVMEDASIGSTVNPSGSSPSVTDPEGNPVVWSIVSSNAGNLFQIDSNTGLITTKNNMDAESVISATGGDPYYTLRIRVTDPSDANLYSEKEIIVLVGNVNEAPSIVSGGTGTVNENDASSIITTVGATDPDGDDVTWRLVGRDAHLFTIDANGNIRAAGSGLDYETRPVDGYQVQAIAQDSGGLDSAFKSISVTVNPVNEAPILNVVSATGAVDENKDIGTVVAGISIPSSDPEGDAISWSIVGGTGMGKFNIVNPATGTITTAQGFDYETMARSYTLDLLASDGKGGSIATTVTINVGDVNETPFINDPGTPTVTENQNPYGFVQLTGSDPENGALSWSIVDSAGGRFNINPDGWLYNTGALDYESATSGYNVVVRATDSGGLTYDRTVHVNVGNVNETPFINDPGTPTVTENQSPYGFIQLTGSDPENAALSWSIVDNAGGRFNINSAGWLYNTGALDYESATGGYDVVVRATDSGGLTFDRRIHVNVGDVAEGPITIDTGWKPSWVTISGLDVNGNATGVGASDHFSVLGGRKDHEIDFIHDTTIGDWYWWDNGESGGYWTRDEITLATGRSEKLVVDLNGNTATSATISLWGFNPNDPTGGAEIGHWDAYRNGVLVAQADFSASNGPNLTIPNIAGGFDKIVFSALGMATGQTYDSSDYGVTSITLYGADARGESRPAVPTPDPDPITPVDPPIYVDLPPLVLDLNRDGQINLISIDKGVVFDMTNDGVLDHTGWVAAEDGQLALDLNGNGIIDNQNELFGSPMGSPLEVNGFTELATYDENDDGKVSSMDSIWSKLIVWQDLNQDGISQADEMKSVVEYEIASISTTATRVDDNVAGNPIYWDGNITMNDGSSMDIVDAYYQVVDGSTSSSNTSATSAIAADPSSIDVAIATTLTEQLSASETTDLDAAIHEFLTATEGQSNTSTDNAGAALARDQVVISPLMPILLTPDENQVQ